MHAPTFVKGSRPSACSCDTSRAACGPATCHGSTDAGWLLPPWLRPQPTANLWSRFSRNEMPRAAKPLAPDAEM
eukprot:643012-Prymnesium_polylepis.1